MAKTPEGRRVVEDAGQAADVALPWLTFEVALYALIFLAGLAARLAALGRWPLLETEISTALAAWRAVQGSSWRPAFYSPLLYDADVLLFWATQATDAAARILPALAGAALTMVPAFARDLLGRKGALAASLLLAFAPAWLFYSRTADGAIVATVCVALLLLSVWRYVRSEQPRDLRLGAIALALGLTSGAGFYTALIFGLGVTLFMVWRWRGEDRLAWARGLLWRGVQRDVWMTFGGVWLASSTALLTNWGGIGASVQLAGHWVRSLAPNSTGLSWWAFPQALLTYEFLTVVLAGVGIVAGLRRRDPLDIGLIGWLGLVLLLGMIFGHREPSWLLDALLPMVILAARGVERVWDALTSDLPLVDALALLGAVLLVAWGSVQLAAYLHTGQERFLAYTRVAWTLVVVGGVVYRLWGETSSGWRVGAAFLALLIIALELASYSVAEQPGLLQTLRIGSGIMVALGVAYGLLRGRDVGLRVGTAIILLLLVVRTARITTAVTYQTTRDPREAIVFRPSSLQIRDLELLVTTLSSRQAGDRYLLDIAYEESLDAWMGWYLRNYPKAQPAASASLRPDATAVIARQSKREEWPAGYIGQRFPLRETWNGEQLSARERLRWFIYRAPVGEAQPADVIEVWVRPPSGK